MAEVSVKVQLHKSEFEPKVFYFSVDHTVEQCKNEICEEFEIIEAGASAGYTLYRVDNFNDPAYPIRKEKQSWSKNNVCSGDLIILKSNKSVTVEEKMTLGINYTASGLPDDCTFLGNIDVSREFKLDELKYAVLAMPFF